MRKIVKLTRFGFVMFALLALPWMTTAQTQPDKQASFEPRDNDRVVFLGNSLIESDQYGYLEFALTRHWAGKKITFRNLGWEGDNVFGQARSHFTNPPTAYETLIKQLTDAKPNIIFLAYGGVEAQEGAGGLDAFKQGLEALLDKAEELDAQVVLLSPIPVLAGIPEDRLVARNNDIQLYAKAISDLAKTRNLLFIDLYAPVAKFQQQGKISADGIHLNETGYYLLATALEQGLGLDSKALEVHIQVTKAGIQVSSPAKLIPAETSLLAFTIEEPYLVLPPSGLPPDSLMQKRTVRISGLKKGYYTLMADNIALSTASAKHWEAGIEIKHGGAFLQSAHVRHLINQKNQLFFQQYRPWNETYITGFRSYEQGRHQEGLANLEYIMVYLEDQIHLNSAPKSINYQLIRLK